MPGMSGLDLIEKIPYLPQVIFTTGNKEYAYEAYEYDITDFLKKPVSPERFEKAIQKVINTRTQRNAVATASANHELYIKSDGKYVRLEYDNILYFENISVRERLRYETPRPVLTKCNIGWIIAYGKYHA